MKKFQRLFSSQTPSRSWSRIAVGTLTVGGIATAIAYFSMNETKSLRKPLRKLPDVDSFVTDQQISDIFTKLQVEKTPNLKSVARIDLNSVASNNPGEDYHSENEFDKGLILGVYDGHGGRECADLISKLLASYVAEKLEKPKANLTEKENITEALKSAFLQLDHDIIQGCISIEEQKSSFWNPFRKPFDINSIMKGLKTAAAGSCAIVAYLKDDDIYIASTGDCRAVLGRKMEYSKNGEITYQTIELSKDQTASNPIEFSRLCEEHPGEDETVVIRGRVLGGLMPSRAFGDARYKWPMSLQEILTPHLKRRIPPNYISPPYVTALPEVVHYKRDRNDKFLIVACDGLWDDLESETAVNIVKNLVEEKYQGNYATKLMKAAMSGYDKGGDLEDLERIRHHLSIPAPKSRRYRDDMTVNVVLFDSAVPGLAKASEKVGPLIAKPTIISPQIYNWAGILKNRPPPSKL